MSLLQDLRHQGGWTQQDVANAATVDVRTVKRWEGEADPPDRVVRLYRSLFANDEASPVSSNSQPMPLGVAMMIVPDPLPLNGTLAPLLGSLPRDEQFTILLGGASGAGKSTAALILAGELADHGAVLVATSEERLRTGTIGIRAKHAGIDPELIDVAEVNNTDELEALLDDGDYAYVVIDSINELGIDPDEASRFFELYPTTAFILVAQADATEKRTVGGARWRHLVDVRLWCERNDQGQRIIRNLKNRYGPQVDQVVLGKGTSPGSRKRSGRVTNSTMQHEPLQDQPMEDTYRWMVGRLEAELASSRQEVRDLRAQLSEKESELREAEVELARFEAQQEANAEKKGKGLGDSFDPEKMAVLADRFAPLIGAVTSAIINRGQQPQPGRPVTAPYVSGPPDFVVAEPSSSVQPSPQYHPFGLDPNATTGEQS